MMKRLFTLSALVLCPVVSLLAEVKITGSDLLGKEFVAALSEYSQRNDLGLEVKLEGSRDGLERLESKRADIGLMVFALGEKPPGAPFVALPVAYHTAVVVVPASLPLTQITYGQLNAIYGDDAQATVKRWSDLGVVGEWANRNVLPTITGPDDAGITYDLFRNTVLTAPNLRPTVGVESSAEASLRRISGEEGGMAIMPALPSGQAKLKALLVARGGQEVAFGATPDNLQSGDYPIRLPVYLVFRKEEVKRLQLTLRYLLSEDAVPLWEKGHVVPLPIQTRNQQIFDLEVL
jgi:phosphate transport system substrate-binding protein